MNEHEVLSYRLLDADTEAFRRIRSLSPTISRRKELTHNLRFMAKYKYDSYEVYSAGKRFLPSLLEWLSQFRKNGEKEAGLIIVRELLFLSRTEMQELSRVTYQNILLEMMDEIIRVQGLNRFDYATAFDRLDPFLEKCVFIGMSDGAQIDYFRRHSGGKIRNEQAVPYYKVDEEEKQFHSKARYAFLLEDMCGSGTTFLRTENAHGRINIVGQFPRFLKKWSKFTSFDAIYYCPYLIAEKGLRRLSMLSVGPKRIVDRRRKLRFKIIPGMIIPETYSILNPHNEMFSNAERHRIMKLCNNYYDREVEDEHTLKGGGCRFGFGGIGIFLVRYNNTPNNTPSILWHANLAKGRKPLFRRLARHHL